MQINRNKQHGFTLIEIIVVMLIIGILAVTVGPKILGRVDDAKIVKVKQDLNAIQSALTLYKLDTGNFPGTDDSLVVLKGKYLPKIPKDPWGEPYIYLSPGDENDYELSTLGADKSPGGEGINADINAADL